MTDPQRHPLNAPGPFFVGRDQCIACMAPEHEAPELMGYDEAGGGCYFRRQPTTPEELTHAINAVLVSCCDAVLYRGDDPSVLKRLAGHDDVPAPRPWWRLWKG